MDIRKFLRLETALYSRLSKFWASHYSAQIVALEKAIQQGKYDAARQLALEFDLTDVGEKNKQLIQYVYQACVLFGAGHFDGPPGVLLNQDTERVIKQSLSNTLQYFEHGGSTLFQDRLVQLIADYEAEPVVQKAEPRKVKPLVSFKEIADDTTQMTASLHMSRLSTWGFMAEAEVRGYTRYKLTAVMDGRTSKFCRWINGKEFAVADAKSKVLQVLGAQAPDDVKALQPWPNQTKAGLEEIMGMSDGDLVARGFHIPPYHPGCRTMCVKIGKDTPRIERPDVAKEKQKLPTTISTYDMFKEAGVELTEAQLEHWNAYIKVNPVDWLTKLSGKTPLEVLEGSLGKSAIKIAKDGDIITKLVGVYDGAKYDAGLIFDPYAGKMYLSKLEFLAGTPTAEASFLKKTLAAVVETSETIGAQSITVAVGSYAYHYGKLGFQPSAVEWQAIRTDLSERLTEGDLIDILGSLTDDRQQLLLNLLSNNNETAFTVLVDLPWDFRGRPLGMVLLTDSYGEFSLSVDNGADKALGYLK